MKLYPAKRRSRRYLRAGMVGVLLALTISLSGCAAKSATHFTQKDVAKVHINPKFCTDIPNTGDLNCNHVRVVLATVDAKESK